MFKRKSNIAKTISIIILALSILFTLPANSVSAAGGLSIYTTYPSIAAKPGENVQTDITLSNNTGSGMTVSLDLDSVPEGWEAFLEGKGRIIDKVYVLDEDVDISLTVIIPTDVKEGKYSVALNASSGEANDRLVMEYDIKSDIENKGTLTTNYTELTGSSDTSFKYEIKVKNNKSESQSYGLSAQTERGWQVKFIAKTDRKQIASIPVEPNQSAEVEVEITPPANVSAGEYVIPVEVSSRNETLTTELKVIITGSYGMELTTPTGRLNAETVAGRKQSVDIVIHNTGSTELKGIKLSSMQPDGWDVEFERDVIDSVAPAESATVKAYIQADEKALAGDYVVKISAETPEVVSSAEFRVMVKTSTLWGVVGILVIIVLVAGLYWVFKKYGRR
jgi:uncharacterized membrane protein